MILGVTGTRYIPSTLQLKSFVKLLKEYGPTEFHHGCCVGVDSITSRIVDAIDSGIIIVGHPPIVKTAVGQYKKHFDWVDKDYLARNKDIVDMSDILLALPRTEFEEKRSGTWATIRYARKKKKVIYIINPDGKYIREN
jgi:hypothetical protein